VIERVGLTIVTSPHSQFHGADRLSEEDALLRRHGAQMAAVHHSCLCLSLRRDDRIVWGLREVSGMQPLVPSRRQSGVV
jgi:hypothetical protein